MKLIMVTFDSLNRRMLPNYGNKEVVAPEFERLGERCTRFDSCYAGSLPCMPARRELHTGRENFLHSRWGPLEPFDDSVPEILREHGIYTHLVTDHNHYWEDEGFGYHSRYSSFRFSRGQEGDPVYGQVERAGLEAAMKGRRVPGLRVQDGVNRKAWRSPEEFPQGITFGWGLDFLAANHQADNWFLHIETFDPHEPFYAPEEFRRRYHLPPSDGQESDWPDYRETKGLSPEQIKRYRQEQMALVSYCSANLGRVLERMDEYDLWKDTMLIVNTDHGFFLGEHGWLGKNTGPYYNEVAHIPLFIYDPRDGRRLHESRDLVQTVDLPGTVLDFFGLSLPRSMTGRPIRGGQRTEARRCAGFGLFGGQINITDGRYVYMRAPRKEGFPDAYTMAGLHFLRRRLQRGEDSFQLSMGREFSFSKGYPLFRVGNMKNDFQTRQGEAGDLLFDLETDPGQEQPICNGQIQRRMVKLMVEWMQALDAPRELFEHYGLERIER